MYYIDNYIAVARFASGCTAESFYARAQIAVLKTMSANEISQAFMGESES